MPYAAAAALSEILSRSFVVIRQPEFMGFRLCNKMSGLLKSEQNPDTNPKLQIGCNE